MPAKNPRVQVTLNPEDLEIIHILCHKKNISMSSLINKIIHDWLEEYEDIKLLHRIEERENDKFISHEEFWDGLA